MCLVLDNPLRGFQLHLANSERILSVFMQGMYEVWEKHEIHRSYLCVHLDYTKTFLSH